MLSWFFVLWFIDLRLHATMQKYGSATTQFSGPELWHLNSPGLSPAE